MNNRKIDILIAEKVLGWTEIKESKFTHFDYVGIDPDRKPADHYLIPAYSTNMAVTWKVVKKLNDLNFFMAMCYQSPPPYHPHWYVAFCQPAKEPVRSEAETLSLTICLAALKSVGVEIEN